MSLLNKLSNDLWTVFSPSKFLLFHVGTRMTVMRLSNGDVLLYSPVLIYPALKKEIDNVGKVTHVVCPNNFHHLYAHQAMALYPQANLHGPKALHKKRKDLSFSHILSDTPHPDWKQDIELLTIEGSLMHETVFYHKSSKVLLTCDIVENFKTSEHLLTRIWLKLGGCHGKISWPIILRLVYINRKKARVSLQKMFEFPFEKVVIAHGEVLEKDARSLLRAGLNWLKV
ncbi:MAG: DUF4336 domain-containing protein [Bermanella sp.]